MDIRVQAYTPPLPSTTRAVAPAVPSRPVQAVTPAASQTTTQTDRAKALAAAAFNSAPATQPPQRGGVAFTSPPEPGQLVNILV